MRPMINITLMNNIWGTKALMALLRAMAINQTIGKWLLPSLKDMEASKRSIKVRRHRTRPTFMRCNTGTPLPMAHLPSRVAA